MPMQIFGHAGHAYFATGRAQLAAAPFIVADAVGAEDLGANAVNLEKN